MDKNTLLKYFDFAEEMIKNGAFGDAIKQQYLNSIKGRKLSTTEKRVLTKNFLSEIKKNPKYKQIVDGVDALFLAGTYYGKEYSLNNILKKAKEGFFTPSYFIKYQDKLKIVKDKYMPQLKQDVAKIKQSLPNNSNVNLVEASGNSPASISTGMIAQTDKSLNNAYKELEEIYKRNKEALENKYKMQDIAENKIQPYQDYSNLLNQDVQLGNSIANQLQQSKIQEGLYGAGMYKNTERILRSGLGAEETIQQQEGLINNKISYDDYKQALEEYRKLKNKQDEYNKYIDLKTIKNNLLQSLVNVQNQANRIKKNVKQSYLYSQ